MLHKHLCPVCHEFWRCGCPDCDPNEAQFTPISIMSCGAIQRVPEMDDLKQGNDQLCPPHHRSDARPSGFATQYYKIMEEPCKPNIMHSYY